MRNDVGMTDASEETKPEETVPVVLVTRPKRVRRGSPWVFSNEIEMSTATKAIAPGTMVRLQEQSGKPVGAAFFNPHSLIAARVIADDPTQVFDTAYVTARLTNACAMRDRLYAAPFYRLIHAEADQLPGIVVDRFNDSLVLQPNAAWAEAHLEMLVAALMSQTGAKNVVKNASGRARALEGLGDGEATALLQGAILGPLSVQMNGATYMADIMGGQKTGLFFDQRPNHSFVQALAKDARVLDMFSHVGGFGLAALAGGAKSALCVDGSAPALALAEIGAERGGLAGLSTRQGDAFAVLEDLGAQNAQFDLVVCDPPAFAPAKPALEAGLRAYERVARLAAPLVAPGGYLVLCSCSHAADLSAFRNACGRGIGRGGRRAQLIHTGFAGADHPMLPQLAESGYLKVLFYRLDG